MRPRPPLVKVANVPIIIGRNNMKLTIFKNSLLIDVQEHVELPSLEVLQKIVGGYLQQIPFFDKFEGQRCIAFCNEEGKILGLQVNRTATRHWHDAIQAGVKAATVFDVLRGPVIVITGTDEELDSL